MASCAVPGSRTTELRGLGSGMDAGRRDQDVDLAVGAELELVDVRLRLRPRAAPDRPLPERRAEGHAEVGALPTVAEEPVGARVVEDAERVVHVRVVHQELLVLVLEVEELRVQRVGPLHDPVEDQPGEAGHPAVALGQVDVGLGNARGLPHHVEGRCLGLHPGVERCIQPVVLHSDEATGVSEEFPVSWTRPVTSERDRHRDRDDADRRAAERAAVLAGQQLGPRPDRGRVVGAHGPGRLVGARAARERLRQGDGPLRRRPGAAGDRRLRGPGRPGRAGAAAGRAHHRHPRHPGADRPLRARHRHRPEGLVPALQRAAGGLGPGRPADPGRQGRRRVDHQRPEGLDLGRPVRRPRHAPGPHRPRRPQAPGHLLLRLRHAPGRRRRAPAQGDDRATRCSTRSSSPTPGWPTPR